MGMETVLLFSMVNNVYAYTMHYLALAYIVLHNSSVYIYAVPVAAELKQIM